MTEPTREQILAAHRALAHLYNAASDGLPISEQVARSIRGEILTALPPKPRPTMAEIEWDNDVHYLAEAELAGWGKVTMLWVSTIGNISVIGDGLIRDVRADSLTPTGKRYTLTEVQE
ncbi:hypothetical protein [Corynebacterium guaraldiae]|uniref:hypothetical protein n=1 Tax=Corynebacterium guaraldiae TaxID=3051103 RepID=UPI0011869F29|nr:hypothetical protein [Corynebacterium guaraldiae]TRX51557.1 hypothetical protein FNY91_09580 [Corynebacterium guaraldiae]